MIIEKTHAGQSDLNLALLNLVAQYGQATYALLFDQFSDASDSPVKAHARFSKKMEYLLFTRQLASSGRGRNRTFFLGPQAGVARSSAATAERTVHIAPEDSYLPVYADAAQQRPGQVVPPPSYNAMAAPVYVAPRNSTALRPGSLDYQRHASFGVRC